MSSPLSLPSKASSTGIEGKIIADFDAVTVITATLVAVSIIAVALRCYVRAKITKTFGWDDGTMVAALCCWIISATLCFIATHAEKLLVKDDVLVMSVSALVQFIRYTNISYTLTMLIAKISIALFFLKLFTANFKWQRITIYTLVGISTLFGCVYMIMTFATCGIMVQSQATTAMHTGSDWCAIQNDFVKISIVWSVLNALTDLVFLVLAIQLLWSAKLPTGTKMSASALLLLGSVGGIASIARIATQTPLQDIRLSGVLLGLWSNVEAGLCITAASLITLRPLFQSVAERTRLAIESYSGRGASDGSSSSSPSSSKIEKVEEDLEMGKMGKDGITITTTYIVEGKDADKWSRSSSSS